MLEENGRILELTLFVLRRALEDQARWSRHGLDLAVAVNISPPLPGRPDFVDAVQTVLTEHPPSPGRLVFEVTESTTMLNPDQAVAALEQLTAAGIAISIDDYGAGQSTLSYLKRLPTREIKIDKGFVTGLESNRSDQVMVRSTIALAHELGFKVVAEGVETEATLQILRDYGCDVAQGWLIGKPVSADALMAQAMDWKGAA